MPIRPTMIRTDTTNAFAHNTMKVRVPKTIRDVQDSNPDYPENIQRALAQLAHEIETDAPIPMLEVIAPDYEMWAVSYASHRGHTWLHTDWFFAEIYFYRLLIEKARWWQTGRDPFAPKKAAELASPELWTLMESALQLGEMPLEERLNALIHSAMWGNRIDLSFAASLAHGNTGSHEDLLTDNSKEAVRNLLERSGDVHIITDNTGTELAMDMVLTDALLTQGKHVIFHLKMHPTFVSDATVPDVWMLLDAMRSSNRHIVITQLGERLRTAWNEGRLHFAPDFYWNSALLLWEMPAHLNHLFQQAALVIIKGDANYRRMVGDALWSPDTPFALVTEYFPSPLLALRTLKSDPIIGLSPNAADELDRIDGEWRVRGKHGVIQYRG